MTPDNDRLIGDIRDCPKCGKPCYVRDGNYPEHDCTD